MKAPVFLPRAKVRKTELSRQRVYRSLCGRWKLIEVLSAYYGRYWLAVRVWGNGGESPISRNRTRKAAESAIRAAIAAGLLILCLLAGCSKDRSLIIRADWTEGQPATASVELKTDLS